MVELDYDKRARNAIRGAIQYGYDERGTTPHRQVEEELNKHISSELDQIWTEIGEIPEDEWDEVRANIIEKVPDVLEEVQDEQSVDVYEKRVLKQFERL